MNRPKFIYVAYIRTTPQKLWRTLTRPESIKQYWFGRQNESSWKTGASIESCSPQGELEWRGKVLERKPPRLLAYTFEQIGEGEPPSRVRFEIEPLGRSASGPKGRGVRLTVTHDRFPARGKVYPGVVRGWPAVLSSLKTLLETGRSLGLEWKE